MHVREHLPEAVECRRGNAEPEFRDVALEKRADEVAPPFMGDLRFPPGNRLEKLSGDRAGEYSIRVNDQWRLCFRWRDGHAHDVGMVDYH